MHVSWCASAAVALRSALDARGAEAALYRKQYEGLCRKLDSLEEHQRQASTAARAKVRHLAHCMALVGIWCLITHSTL